MASRGADSIYVSVSQRNDAAGPIRAYKTGPSVYRHIFLITRSSVWSLLRHKVDPASPWVEDLLGTSVSMYRTTPSATCDVD